MGILNLTPDSFSDDGVLQDSSSLIDAFENFDRHCVQIFDLGSYSTRPGAKNVSVEDEFQRIKPALEL